jgi:DNA-binding transcriptional ArsR family regulator
MLDDMRELACFFKALGDETRLGLVALLAQQEPGRAMCVGRLARELGVTASAVSQHLRVLKDLGLVHAERRGYRLHYFLDLERLAAHQELVREQLGEDFVIRAKGQPVEGGGEEHVLL